MVCISITKIYMKKLFALGIVALALAATGCNKEGTDTETAGNATPATSASIVGKWYNPNDILVDALNLPAQPEFEFKADGTITGNYYSGTWEMMDKGVLKITPNNSEAVYVLPYTMYNSTVLIMRYDIPEISPEGYPVINMGKGFVEFFYKDGKAAASNKADIQGKWSCFEGWDENGDGEVTEDEQMASVSVTFNGDKFELVIHVWNGELYSGTYTYKDGFVYFHPTRWVSIEGEQDPKENSLGYENNGDFVFPVIGNGDELYAYIIEGRGAWKKVK